MKTLTSPRPMSQPQRHRGNGQEQDQPVRHRHAVHIGHALRHPSPVGARAAVVETRRLEAEPVPRLFGQHSRTDRPGAVRPPGLGLRPQWPILPQPPRDVERPDAGRDIAAPLPKVSGLAPFTADEVHVPMTPYPQHHRGYAEDQRHRRREMKEFPPHNVRPISGRHGDRDCSLQRPLPPWRFAALAGYATGRFAATSASRLSTCISGQEHHLPIPSSGRPQCTHR